MTGEMRLWSNDRLVATRITETKPFRDLHPDFLPGVGIGNVETDGGFGNNQPLNGVLADLRLYSSVLEPSQSGWRPWSERP